ncbi:DNA-packaging protein [Escherichia coli]|nr:DNA-packaging protein [Escherichia coli]
MPARESRWRVLSGDPTGYGAATSRVFAIYENFPV